MKRRLLGYGTVLTLLSIALALMTRGQPAAYFASVLALVPSMLLIAAGFAVPRLVRWATAVAERGQQGVAVGPRVALSPARTGERP